MPVVKHVLSFLLGALLVLIFIVYPLTNQLKQTQRMQKKQVEERKANPSAQDGIGGVWRGIDPHISSQMLSFSPKGKTEGHVTIDYGRPNLPPASMDYYFAGPDRITFPGAAEGIMWVLKIENGYLKVGRAIGLQSPAQWETYKRVQ
jgi:hypothetical protein